jgi:hypothetical protein
MARRSRSSYRTRRMHDPDKLARQLMLPEVQAAREERERQQREEHRRFAEFEAAEIQRQRQAHIAQCRRTIEIIDAMLNPPQADHLWSMIRPSTRLNFTGSRDDGRAVRAMR